MTQAPTPEMLLKRWRSSREADALGVLFDQTAPALLRVALSILPDAASAEDALQETYLTLLDAAERHDPARPVVPWLVGILKNHARRLRRQRSRTPDPHRIAVRGVVAASPSAQDPDAWQALDALPEPYRTVGLLHWRYGLAPAEIAHLREEPPGTTRSTLTRARQRLRDRTTAPVQGALPFAAPQGLAVLRTRILEQSASSALSSALVVGGVTMAKKSLIGLAVLLLLVSGGLMGWNALTGVDAPDFKPPESMSAATTRAEESDRPVLKGLDSATGPAAEEAKILRPIRGLVVDAGGEGIANAKVSLVACSRSALVEPNQENVGVAHTRSDVQGRFLVEAPEGERAFDLVVRAGGFSPAFVLDARVGETHRIALSAAGVLEGRVIDTEEQPIAGVVVELHGLLHSLPFLQRSVTGADGRYRLDTFVYPGNLPRLTRPLAWHLEVVADAYPPLYIDQHRLPRPCPGLVQQRDIVLTAGATLTGSVRDAETRAPIAGAVVLFWTFAGRDHVQLRGARRFVHPDRPKTLGRTRTDADGMFTIEGLPAKGFDEVQHGGFLGWVAVGGDGFSPVVQAIPVPAVAERMERAFTLHPATTVEGHVRNAQGEPVKGAYVLVRPKSKDRTSPPMWTFAPRLGDVPRSHATTDAEGHYVIEGAPAGRDEPLEVELSALAERSFAVAHVSLQAGRAITAPNLQFQSRGAASICRGRICAVNGDGTPVVDLRVYLSSKLWRPIAQGDETGCVEVVRSLRSDAGSTLTCVVRARGCAPALVDVPMSKDDMQTVRVTLEPGHGLRGRVVHADGSPAASAHVTVSDGALSVAEAFTQPASAFGPGPHKQPTLQILGAAVTGVDGRFRIAGLSAGPYHVQARLERRTNWAWPPNAPLEVVRSKVEPGLGALTLTLPPSSQPATGRILGRAVDAETGRGVLGIQVRVERGRPNVLGVAIGPGRFAIEDVPAGAWRLRVRAAGYLEARVEDLEVVPGAEPMTVGVKMHRGTVVTGIALNEQGKPLAEHEIVFTPARGVGWRRHVIRATLDAKGHFRATGFEPGRYRAHAAKAGWSRFPGQRSLAPLGNRQLEVEPDRREVRYEARFVAAGELDVIVPDDRLPMPPTGFDPSSKEAVAFGEACVVRIKSEAGAVLAEQEGICGGGYMGNVSSLYLVPGTYIVALVQPRGVTGSSDVREQTIPVEAGQRTRALFNKP